MTLTTSELRPDEENQDPSKDHNHDHQKQDIKSNSQEDVFEKLKALTDHVNKLQAKLDAKEAAGPTVKVPGFNVADSNNFVQQLADAIKLNSKPELDFEGGIPEEAMDPADYHKEGTRFCCPRVGYSIHDDKRKNQRVLIPYNKKSIFFAHIGTRVLKVGKYDSTAPICAYISHSYKETKWLREHTKYKVDFYENANDAAHADSERILRMSTVMAVIKNYELPQLMSVCTDYGIGVTPDAPEKMSFQLAIKMVDRQMELEKQRTTSSLNEAYKASLIRESAD